MTSCNNVPVELVLATSDPNLYNSQKKWLWTGQLYWTVVCLAGSIRIVDDRKVPGFSVDSYKKLETSPSTWDFCKSHTCSPTSELLQIIFTFDPTSKDPNDYLQYVIDIHCNVTDYPRHNITDKAGKKIYLNIEEVSKLPGERYVEVWLSKTSGYQGITLEGIPTEEKTSGGVGGVLLWILIALIILAIIGTGIYFFLVHKNQAPVSSDVDVYIG